MIAYWNRSLRCEFANEGYRNWFGIPPQQAVGMSMPEIMGDLYAGVENHVHNVLQGHAQRFERLNLSRPIDGKPACLEIRYIPDVDGSPEVRGFFSLVTDTTVYRIRE
jgi:two-component system, sensor histidine kinase and response regulator